jgi:hypothetical protein
MAQKAADKKPQLIGEEIETRHSEMVALAGLDILKGRLLDNCRRNLTNMADDPVSWR